MCRYVTKRPLILRNVSLIFSIIIIPSSSKCNINWLTPKFQNNEDSLETNKYILLIIIIWN